MKTTELITITALALFAVSCGSNSQSTGAAAGAAETIPNVEVSKAIARDVPQESAYASTVQAWAVNNIMPQQGGRIRKINVEVGDYVQKGQVQHVEEPPVLGNRGSMGKACQEGSKEILFFLGVIPPDLFSAGPESDDQCTGLHGLLIGTERIRCPGCLLQVFIVAPFSKEGAVSKRPQNGSDL